MPIEDNNPERRNLMVTSLAFIAYFLGGGSVKDDTIELAVVNVAFEHGWVLAVMAWLMLFWFALRYWQACKDKFPPLFNAELNEYKFSELVVDFVEESVVEKLSFGLDYDVKKLELTDDHDLVVETIGLEWGENKKGERVSSEVEDTELLFPIAGEGSFAIKRYLYLRCAVSEQAITSWLVPYLVFFLAVLFAGSSMLIDLFGLISLPPPSP